MNAAAAAYHGALQLLQQGAFGQAAACLEQGLAAAPAQPELHFLLLQALLLDGRPRQAQAHYRQRIATELPLSPERCYWQGMLLEQTGQPALALAAYRQAISIAPDHADSLLQLARLEAAADPPAALASYRRLLGLVGRSWQVLPEYALLLAKASEHAEAATIWWELLEQFEPQPGWLEAWLASQVRSAPQAIPAQLAQLAAAYPGLGLAPTLQAATALRLVDRLDLARDCLAQAERQASPDQLLALRLQRELMLLPLMSDRADIMAYARRATAALAAAPLPERAGASDENLPMWLQLWEPLAWLPYLNLDPLPLRQAYGRLFQARLPLLPPPVRKATDRPRLAFVLNSNAAVRAFLSGVFRHWPAERAQVTLVYTAPDLLRDELAPLRPDFAQLTLSTQLPQALEQLRQAEFDLIFYTEIYTDRLGQAYWAAHRLAPIQITSWLSSGSSGLSTVDLFLSSRLLEQQQDPQRFYSERLLLLEQIPTCLPAPVAPPQLAEFELPAGHLYLCAHLLFKLHPDFDQILAGILAQDPKSWILLQERPADPILKQRIQTRLQAATGRDAERLIWLPAMPAPDFLGLMQRVDLMLDPFYFGGGTTSFEALGLGLPIVTWPGERLHGRITAAYYTQMGLADCIADSPESYLKQALRLATDRDWNLAVRERILARRDRLFEQRQAVQELASCLVAQATASAVQA